MAFYLQFTHGVNDHVDLPSVIQLDSDYHLKLRASLSASDSLGAVMSNVAVRWMGKFSGNYILYFPEAGIDIRGEVAVNGQELLFEIINDAGQVSFFVDGVLQGTGTQTLPIELKRISRTDDSGRGPVEFYGCIIESPSGNVIHNYDPSASNGTGQILPDTVGGNDGTLINFPTDDSQWIFYDDGGGAVGVTADVTESSSDFSESSSASFTANISAQVTEVSASFSESSSATITNNLITLSVTELSQSFTESSTAEISANISAVVTELAQDFNESAQVNLTSSFTVEVTETTSDFEEACYIQLPVIRLTPRKTISVSNRRSSTIRVRSRNNVIRVK